MRSWLKNVLSLSFSQKSLLLALILLAIVLPFLTSGKTSFLAEAFVATPPTPPTPPTTVTPTVYPTTVPTSTPTSTPTPVSDKIAPKVLITYPKSGSIVRKLSFVNIRASASDNTGGSGMDRVEFLINGKSACTDRQAPYICNWRVPWTWRPQIYFLTARAFDKAGNKRSTSIIVIAK